MRNLKKITIAGVLLLSATAFAGRGGSASRMAAAIQSRSVDAIIGEVEKAEKLACIGCIDVVLPLVDHDSAKVRDVAGWWLGKRGVRTRVLADMIGRLSQQDPIRARNAGDVLGGMRDRSAVTALSAYVRAPLDEASGAAAAKALGAIGHPSALPALTEAAKSSLPGVRTAAVAELRNLRAPVGQKAAASASAIVAQLSDGDAGVRREAAYTLGHIQDPAGVPALQTALTSDSDAAVRKAAAWALGQIGDLGAIAALKAAQNDADANVRSIAGAALGRLK
jgi:HEAT repeat protein